MPWNIAWAGARHVPRASGSRRYWSGLEPLEARQLLTVSAGADALVALADEPPALIQIYRAGELVEALTPGEDTNAARGTLLRDVLAAARAGDLVLLGAATFDMGGQQHVDFPDDVTVRGSGKLVTRITSSCPQSVDPAATFELNDGSVVEDLWLEGALYNGLYQPLVGTQLPQEYDIATYLRRVRITGDSDGIFVWGSSIYDYKLYAYDCDIETRFDGVALLGSGLKKTLIELYNCSITVSQPSAIPAHMSNAVNARSGTVGLYNCTINVAGDENSAFTNGIWNYNFGTSIVANTVFNVSSPSGQVYDLFVQNDTTATINGGSGSGAEGAYNYLADSGSIVFAEAEPTVIHDRQLFYNNSAFDGGDPESNSHDSQAIATDKFALLPGAGQATFANVSSYVRGINGIAIDLEGSHGSITADDFQFRLGNSNSPLNWTAAPAPRSVTIWNGIGAEGSDRVEIVWDDGAIVNQWLEVTLLANLDTGLAAPDTFYFGSADGNTGLGDTQHLSLVNVTDELAVRNNPASLFDDIPITNSFDLNRDRKVDISDQLLARNGYTNAATVLRYLDLGQLFAAEGAISLASAATEAGEVAGLLAAWAIDAAAEDDSSGVQWWTPRSRLR